MPGPGIAKKSETFSARQALMLLGIIVAVGLGLRFYQARIDAPFATALIVINSGSITAEIADTPEMKELGLGGRDGLEPRHGMYFPFATSGKWVFWMKGMRFPLDAVWIRDGVVVDVTRNARPPNGGTIERFSPSEPADAVLEINAGEADALSIKKGDKVNIRY